MVLSKIQIGRASAISHVFAQKSLPDEIITFFFPQFSDPESLLTETIVRSIIRQSLDRVALSDNIMASLAEIDQNPSTGIQELTALLRRRLAQSKTFYIFIDALDELDPIERRSLLDLLVTLGSTTPNIKVFLAGRESLSAELKKRLPDIEHLSMASPGAKADIALYIKEALDEKIQNGDLVFGDPFLVLEVEEALTKHADGM